MIIIAPDVCGRIKGASPLGKLFVAMSLHFALVPWFPPVSDPEMDERLEFRTIWLLMDSRRELEAYLARPAVKQLCQFVLRPYCNNVGLIKALRVENAWSPSVNMLVRQRVACCLFLLVRRVQGTCSGIVC